MKKVLVLSVLAVFSLCACKEKEAVVIAKVGGAKITDTMLAEKLENTPPAYQNYVNTALGRKQFVDAVVRENIMLEAARQAGVNKRSEYNDLIAEFKQEQARQFNEYQDGLLIETYLKEIHNSILASDADIEQYYNQNKELFDAPVAYTAKHVLLTSREEAETAFGRLQSGESFDTVAREMSQDTASAANGGLIGTFKRGELVPEFEKVALELKNGEMSEIVETPYGFHIILKVSDEKLPAIPFEKAQAEIKRTIEKERFDKWFEDARQKLGVTVDYAAAESVSITGDMNAVQLPQNASLEM
jgi:Parvulin-like peptidyl-prolyl isomerase